MISLSVKRLLITMKQSQVAQPSTGAKVENKDNLDSGHKEEEMVKKYHITNNQKENPNEGKSPATK